MDQRADSGEPVLLSDTASIAGALVGMVTHPDEIDRATQLLGIPAALVNPALSTSLDLEFLGLGPAVHIPVQIADRAGGRKSLYYLRPGERVLTGLIAARGELISRFTTRETGSSIPAATGDEYSEELRSADGTVIATLRGTLEVRDRSRGHGSLTFTSGSPEPVERAVRDGDQVSWIWIFWSMIATGSAIIAISSDSGEGAATAGFDIRGDDPVR